MSNASLELGGDNWAAKDGNLLGYAVGDSSGRYVPREFTFTRGSNLAATRVAANGLIEKGRENLLLQSNQFESGWYRSGTNETSGQNGYDGSSNAWLLTKNVSDGYIYQNISQSGVQCVSVYAKANAIGGIQIYVNAGTTREQSFNLTNGTLIGSGNNIDAKIESVGNGWYRCSMALSDAITRVRFYPMTSAGDKTGTSGSIYIQDAQLEQGLVATDYIETGATTVKAGLLEDEPRIDYTGGTGSLLLEPSRTNLIPYTEYFEGLSLSNSPTITQNYAVSPEGVQNAVRVQDTDATNFKIMQTQFSVTAGSTYTISVYVKKATSPISTYGGFYFDFDGGTRKTSNLIFDEYNGTLVNASGNAITSVIHPVIDEGDYWRFSATATDTGSNTLLRPTLRAGASANGTSVGLAIKDYIAYGFQCEQASYPTSYIPNHSGGSVTRGGDSAITIPSAAFEWDGLASGDSATLFIETKVTAVLNNNFNILSQGGSGVWKWNSTSFFARTNNPATAPSFSMGVDINTLEGSTIKIAFVKDDGNLKMFYNGNSIGVVAIGTAELDWCSHISSNYQSAQGLKQFAGFNTALSDAQCSALTVEGLKEEILTSYIAAVDTLEDGAEARLDTYLQNLEDLIV